VIDGSEAALDGAADATTDADLQSPVEAEGEAVIDAEAEPVPSPLDDEEPAHVDDEPEHVAEFAEPGAEDGAHAELRVDPPWPAYGSMKVADIRERVAVADAAELAVVQLFESTHRNRKSILDAVERRSRELANSPSAR
jgi:hypothetical protein